MKNTFSIGSAIKLSAMLSVALHLNAQSATTVIGDTVTDVNVFEDSIITGGIQTVFGMESGTVVDPGVDLAGFIGFYDLDFSDTSLELTLIDNSGATNPIIPAGRFDRHYIGFDHNIVTSVSLDGTAGLNEFASVQLLAPGFELNVADLFGTGISMPIPFPNGGFLLAFGEGSDFTTLGVTANVNFETTAVPEPGASILLVIGVGGLIWLRRSRKSE